VLFLYLSISPPQFLYMGPQAQHYAQINPAEVASNTGYIEYAVGLPVKMDLGGFQDFDWFVRMYVAPFMPGKASLDESEYSALL
jgi:hypothetical protein